MLDIRPVLYLVASAFVLASVNWCRKQWENRSRLPLPPGPPCLPILGSILSLDPVRPWLSFNALRFTYGDIIYARLLTRPVVVVNSEKVARDLFELRSTIYSDRPQSIVYEAFALDFSIPLFPYGDSRWRLHRRIFHQQFRQAAIYTYYGDLLRSTHKMLFSFLQDPHNYTSHIQMFTSSFILSIVYGYQPTSKDDHVVRIILKYMELAVAAGGPGAAMVMETFPFLLQLPVWFPGATFKRASVECHQAGQDAKEIPFQDYNGLTQNHSQSSGQMPPCLVADTMNRMSGFENEVVEAAIKEAACIAFGVMILGSAQTSGTILVFLLAMILHPEVQAKAQADIDRVVGKDRLPDFNDRPTLPYVEAVLRETLRWHPVLPFGVPHATTTSDIYNGYFIPKGSYHC
ncbi:cytochrome P450 [Rhizopogon vinicolor AM-OR11-026]|uniref:Cytochrome P450 n=1 Tax=Rhizopogon vinicolor AM-OR11-026 TaxID=1314800 RepID=A0A1B7MQB3_9AGAM|nr:cytochrome P450 [Rhizopogon vinicolor AM-OR11-026]